jgi:hypothetical protein
VNMKPLPKIVFAIVLMMLTIIGLKAGIDHGYIPTPGTVRAVMQPQTPGNVGVQRDGDWNIAQSYSNGDDALIGKYRQPDDTTGFPALDNILRYVWSHCGTLMLVFGLLTGITILGSHLNADSETHNEQMRREAEELESPGLSEDIHEPFNAPEGMQPATQYVPIRTRH